MNVYKIYPWVVVIFVLIFIVANFIYTIVVPSYNFPFEFKIKKGESVDKIAQILEENQIISSKFIFKLYLFLKGKTKDIKAGNYKIEEPVNMIRLVEILTRGGVGKKIKIIPGFTLKDIEVVFKKNDMNVDLQKYTLGDFPELNLKDIFGSDKRLEGFLFPDTYEFLEDQDEREIVLKILKNFEKKALPYIEKEERKYDALILASLIEKEVILPEEKLIVSDILKKRLEKDMKLEVDASVVYAKCDGYYYFCKERDLGGKDLFIDSPYNTYRFKGLPPSPISNPGIDSLRAVANPTKNEFYFYFTTKEGKAIFSKTKEEHQKKVNIFLK